MMKASAQASLEMGLKELRLPVFMREYQPVAKEVLEGNMSCEQYLGVLVEREVEQRRNNRIKTLLKQAKYPVEKSLTDFDFTALKSVKKQSILELCEGSFLNEKANLVFYGGPGTGKTHLAIAIGRELCLRGKSVLFFTGCSLVQELSKASNNLTLTNFFRRMARYDLIIIDELGFIPFEKNQGDLLFQFISDRYEKGSLLITTNLAFKEWDKIFMNAVTASAAIDRLIHHSYIFEFKEEKSYRTKVAQKRLQNKN